MFYDVYFVKVEYFLLLFLENNQLLHNRSILLSLKTCYQVITFEEYFKVALYVEIKPWLCDHVNHNKFCFHEDWTNNTMLNI